MKVAIVHYWLVSMRGGEKVVEALCDIYPQADIFTLVVDRSAVSGKLSQHRIVPSFLNRVPGARRHYTSLLPLMPMALEHLDLSDYDLVLSSESGPAKGVLPRPDAVHVCYCHSPMRYIWDHYHQYRAQSGWLTRAAMPLLAPSLRQWDSSAAQRVDRFVANSGHVANRIRRYYRRQAQVIHPPVTVDDFAVAPRAEDFYLCAGQLVGYKRVDLAVEAFTRLGKPLVVIGTGSERKRLERMAGPNVTFLGYQPFAVMRDHMARCRALVFPGEEDFGLVPVEAMASGRPVVAFGRGGATETVRDGETGVLFNQQTAEALIDAVERLEASLTDFNPQAIRAHARVFDVSVFRDRMRAFVDQTIDEHYAKPAATAPARTADEPAEIAIAAAPGAASSLAPARRPGVTLRDGGRL
jgi:glycosyltransferase involved in cell wall biosynthesis